MNLSLSYHPIVVMFRLYHGSCSHTQQREANICKPGDKIICRMECDDKFGIVIFFKNQQEVGKLYVFQSLLNSET